MKKTYKKRKYNTGVQRIYNDTPDYSDIDNKLAKKDAQGNLINSMVTTGADLALPGLGIGLNAANSISSSLAKNDKGLYKSKTAEFLDANLNPLSTVNKLASGDFAGVYKTTPLGMGLSALGVDNPFGKTDDEKLKEEYKKKEKKAILANAQKLYQEGSSTDAQSFLAKKGKYKVKPRIIESEGREPVFSPKKKDGSRDLLYFDPNGKNHSEGGEKLAVVAKGKYKKGTNELRPSQQKTQLPEGQNIAYKSWLKNNKINESDDYDMAGYWKSEGFKTAKHTGHFPDTYKMLAPFSEGDGYMTLSDESKFASKFDKRGQGTWVGDKFVNYKCGTSKMKYGDGSKKLVNKPTTQDSLDLYNQSKAQAQKIGKWSRTGDYTNAKSTLDEFNEIQKKGKGSKIDLSLFPNAKVDNRIKNNTNIKPIGEQGYFDGKDTFVQWGVYKKPTGTPKPIVDTRNKTNIEPLTPKQASLNVDSFTPDRILKPVPVNVDKSNRKFAQYPNMKKQLRYKKSANRMVNAKSVDNIVNTFAKGTSSIKAVIPEGSSIITAEGGKNIQAINAYKRKDYKTLDKIINSMPEDKSSKKDEGSRWTIATDPTEDNIKGELDNTVKLRKAIQEAIKTGDYSKAQKLGGYLDKNKNWVYKNPNKKYKGKEELAAKNNYNEVKPLEIKMAKVSTANISTPTILKTPSINNKVDNPKGFDGNNLLSSIPSIAEIAARQSLLSKGVDKVPENYVKFGRYKYASQLPKNLQENMMATNTAKQSVKNASGGNTGNYLSNVSNIMTSRLKANNDAVINDTLARQDVLNKNVDVTNNETQINVGLKNQFNDMKAQNLGAYRDQILAQGRSIDSTIDSAKKESWMRKRDEQLTNNLKSRNYKWNKDTNTFETFKGGSKKIKYKTTRK